MDDQRWVAIVDDDPSVRSSLSRVLRCVGIHARTYESAEEYLRRSSHEQPHCILLDIHLGAGLNGFELRERLESNGSAPPIIFVTGQTDVELPVVGKLGQPIDSLRKPFDAAKLIACVRRHVPAELSTAPT